MTASRACNSIMLIVMALMGIASAGNVDHAIITDASELSPILDQLASNIQANFEKIKTLKGRVKNRTIGTYAGEKAQRLLKQHTDADPQNLPNNIQRIIDSTLLIEIDLEKSKFLSIEKYVEPYIYLDVENNKTYPSSMFIGDRTEIVTPSYKVEITPLSWSKADRVIKRWIAMKSHPYPVARVDPRDLYYMGNRTMSDVLSKFSDSLQRKFFKGYGIVIKKASKYGRVTYRVEIYRSRKKKELLTVLTLDSQAGCNATYIENWNGDGSIYSKITNEFVKIEGLYLPAGRDVVQYYPDGSLMRHEHYTVTGQQANYSIPDSVFSEFTYLKDGDAYNNKITKKLYRVASGKLVEDN